MLSFISYLQTIYNFFIISPLSVIIGFFVGGIIGLLVELPKSMMTLLGLFILVCLSPKIGKNVYLETTFDVNILVNALLFTTTLTILIIILYRFYKLDKKLYSKENR